MTWKCLTDLADNNRSQSLRKDPAKDGGQAEDGRGERSLLLGEPNLTDFGAHGKHDGEAQGQHHLTAESDPELVHTI